MTSRSALEFLQRNSLVAPMLLPRPRLNITDLGINQLPAAEVPPNWSELLALEGLPPTDRGDTQPWPDEVTLS